MKLSEWIFRAKITKREFCKRVGIGYSHLYYLQFGKRRPSEELMERIRAITDGKITTPRDLKDLHKEK